MENFFAIGRELQPCLVLDDFYDEPDSLIRYAMEVGGVQLAQGGYPGVRSPAPMLYNDFLMERLPLLLKKSFNFKLDSVTQVSSAFSMVTLSPNELSVEQRVPHFDSCVYGDLALILYLCAPSYGGTNFYRHRETGFEFVDEERRAEYFSSLRRELTSGKLPKEPAYICDDTALYERVFQVPVAYNRLAIYRVTSLHSGDIPPEYQCIPDPREGRFTLTTFLTA